MFRLIPYWPLFLFLVITFTVAAWFYMRNVPPGFKVTASVQIKDQQKGLYNSRLSEAFNIYNFYKIAENESEVLHSRQLIREVITNLNLNAPVYEKGLIWSRSAYLTSPIMVKVQDPSNPVYYNEDYEKIYFTFNNADNAVELDKKSYPLNQWVKTGYGTLMFTKNDKQIDEATKPLFFYLIPPKEMIEELEDNIETSQVSKFSSVINLVYYDEVPQRGEDVLNELIRAYDRQAMTDKNKIALNTVSFVEERIRNAQRELDSIENSIKRYKSEKGIVNLSEQGSLFLQNVAENDQKISGLNIQMAVLDKVEQYVTSKDQSSGIVPSTLGVDDPVLSKLLDRLYDSEVQYDKLKRTTAENNPIMTTLVNEIDKTRTNILDNLEQHKRALATSKDKLNKFNSASTSVLRTIPEKERALLEINRQQLIKNDIYTFLLQKREETAFSLTTADPDSRIVNSVQAAIKPASPKKKVVFAAALILSFVVGFLIISFKEFLNSKIMFRSEIEEGTSVPIISEVLALKKHEPLVIHNKKNVMVAEQFKQMAAALGLYSKSGLNKKILVTSSVIGEGKSFISNNLALSLALAGKKVVLMDFDLRSPRTSKIFDASDSIGITEYLQDNLEPFELIKRTKYDNLFLVPAGQPVHHPTELLLNGNLDQLFSYLESTFDYIIADTSPVDPVSDAYILSDYFDKTVFVIRHGYTPKQMVEMLDDSNKIKALKGLKIVFNGVKSRGFITKSFGFGYGYGYENVYGNSVYAGRKPAPVYLAKASSGSLENGKNPVI
jgi:capsular exopolysaccharide synthesis family protein